MDDIVVFKTPDYMYNGIHFSDIGQKLVAQTFTFAGAFDKPGNVNNFYSSRLYPLGTTISDSLSSLSSGTVITPKFGSLVAKDNLQPAP